MEEDKQLTMYTLLFSLDAVHVAAYPWPLKKHHMSSLVFEISLSVLSFVDCKVFEGKLLRFCLTTQQIF